MLSEMGEHGQGGITRRADGRLQVAVTMLDGRRVFRYVPKDRDRARQRRRAEALRRSMVGLRERDLEPSSQTLADYLREWISGLPDGRRPPRPRTIEHYRYVVERYLIPALGDVRLDRLTPRRIQAWVDADRTASAHHRYAVLRRALNVAKRQHILADNPATAIEPPEASEYRGRPLEVHEIRALLLATTGDRLNALWRLAMDSGLRVSELLGLSWDDLDLDAGRLTVRNQLYRAEGRWALVDPKTAREEPLNLAPSTVAALREHQRRMAAERTPAWVFYGLVFVTPKGQPISRSDVLRAFHEACDAAGIARRRVHDLRGTTASVLQDEDVPEHVRMARLGHVTTRMARHYAGQSDVLDRQAAMALERVLG